MGEASLIEGPVTTLQYFTPAQYPLQGFPNQALVASCIDPVETVQIATRLLEPGSLGLLLLQLHCLVWLMLPKTFRPPLNSFLW